ncbi:MAG: integrase arm-type DNA-binding domain-containing protein [Pseudomonadota bacterium]
MSRQLHTLTDIQLKGWIKQREPIPGASDGGGLTFTLSKAGTASWTLRYRFGGKRKELTIGNYPDITLAQARQIASHNRALVDQGVDPGEVKAARKKAEAVEVWTVKKVAADYEAKRLAPGGFAESTIYGRKLDLKNIVVPHLGAKRIEEVTGRDVVEMLRKADKGWTASKRALTTATKMFEHAAGLHLVNINPCVGVSLQSLLGPRPAIKPRVMLSEDDLRSLLATMDTLGRANSLAMRILLSTCVRTSELVRARWENIDLEKGTWFVPSATTKTRRGFFVPLMPAVIDWFRELQVLAGSSPFVLPARVARKEGETITARTLWAAIDRAFKTGRLTVTKFTPHDARSTAKSHMRNLGVTEWDSERALSHAIKGVSGIYDVRDELPEKRAALTKWSDLLHRLSAPASTPQMPAVTTSLG